MDLAQATNALNSLPLRCIEAKAALDDAPKRRRLYDETFSPRGR